MHCTRAVEALQNGDFSSKDMVISWDLTMKNGDFMGFNHQQWRDFMGFDP